MFATKPHRNNSAKRPARRLSFQQLEGREMMTTTWLVIDFTPDTHAGSFLDTFATTRIPGTNYAPNWFDFNGDRRLTTDDVNLAAGQIAYRVQSLFASAASGYDVQVRYGDVLSQTNWGTQVVQWGRQYTSQLTAVMFVGGRNGTNIFGRAPIAADGYNVEGYGQTYSQEIANSLIRRDQQSPGSVTKTDFVNAVAATISHELGHMLGLRHSTYAVANNIMNTDLKGNYGAYRFLNQGMYTQGGAVQNPYLELRRSFAGQREAYGVYGAGGHLMDDHDHHHTHEGETTLAPRNVVFAGAKTSHTAAVDEVFRELGDRPQQHLSRVKGMVGEAARGAAAAVTTFLAHPGMTKTRAAAVAALSEAAWDSLLAESDRLPG